MLISQSNFSKMILIFSIQYDWSTSCIIHWLNSWGLKVIRINGDDNVYKFDSLTDKGIFFKNTLSGEVVNLKEAKACWWRRTGIKHHHLAQPSMQRKLEIDDLDLTSFISGGETDFLKRESKALIEYIVQDIYETCPRNLGKPVFDLNRLIVLDMAKKIGLKIPEYEILNSGKDLFERKDSFGKAVTKAIANGIAADVKGSRFYSYTELLEEEFYIKNKNYQFFPSLVTKLVEKKLEIRSFYIDGIFYSMAIFSQSNEKTSIDFRKYSNNRLVPYQLPKDIELKIHSLFLQLDLNSGSIDLIVDSRGEYIFLEINPVGQFSMTSEPCNYNLEKIVANYLANGINSN